MTQPVLTDAEMHALISGNPFTLGLSIARLKDFIRQVEKAVIAKQNAEQEPIGYLHANEVSFLSAKGITAEQARTDDYNIPLYTHPAPNPKVFNLTIPEAEAYIKQLESENDAKYVAFGADAYYHSCKELELWQQERLNKGLDEGPQGTLIGWMNWAQEFMDSFRVPASVTRLQSEVEQMTLMLENKEWADHAGQSDLGKRLEVAISTLHNELYEAQVKRSKPELTRNQPCGCVVCYCENEDQCQDCGAKNCGTHEAGEIPNPVYADHIPDASKMIEHDGHCLETEVKTMVEMLEAKEWAEHVGQTDLGSRLEVVISTLHNELHQALGRVREPDGWQLVPKKMALDMSIAFAEQWYSKERSVDDDDMQDAYEALLAEAPKYNQESLVSP